MKKITKICAVVAACLATIGLTGCPDAAASIGKDDFVGTWMTLDIDGSGEPKTCYHNTNVTPNGYYSITWNFDGRSENMFNGNGGRFWQHLVNYSDANMTTVQNETFWFGQYAIKGNSGYSKGKLYLYYQCGYDIDDAVRAANAGSYDAGAAKILFYDIAGIKDDELGTDNVAWKLEDFLNAAFNNSDGLANLNNETLCGLAYNGQNKNGSPAAADTKYYNGAYVNHNVTVQVRNQGGKMKCSDIEYFRFNLKDGSASGYTRMMATVLDKDGTENKIGGIYNQWVTADEASGDTIGDNIPTSTKKFNGGYKVKSGCSWSDYNTRYMGRISVKSSPTDPIWLYSSNKTNNELFSLNDSKDHTDYEDVDSNVSAEE
ncbi:MAG: hypothetical protein IKI90_08620 [Treponema sp.]|nr:hypothetical protein [Treponema sp.]